MTLEEFQSLRFGDSIIQRDKSGDAIGIVIETNKQITPVFGFTVKVDWSLNGKEFQTRYKQNESFLWRHFEIYKRAGE